MTTLVIPTEEVHAVVGPPQGQWTYANWESLPDDGNRYEMIEGVLYLTTAPSSFHQWIVRRLERYVGIPAEDQGLALSFPAPIGVSMPGCAPVQPDCAVVLTSNGSVIRNGIVQAAPDAMIEVMPSRGSAAYYQGVKLEAYALASVPEYAIIDAAARTLSHYQLVAEGQYAQPQVFSETETVRFSALPTISVPVSQLFAGAPDTTL